MKASNILAAALLLAMVSAASADSFGTDGNQFTIDFVTISGATNPTSGIPAGTGFTFTGVNNDYRIGIYEITNDQWNKFKASLGVPVTGDPSNAYDESPYWTGTNMPTTGVSWYEAAQFVNWLNTSKGHQAAYKFTGTQGTDDYTLATWDASEAAGGTNLYRRKDAFYFLPTEDEWVKAAYWNGTALQTHATKAGETLFQGNGSNGGWNYEDDDYGPDGPGEGPWSIGSGSQELNGTYDMMGNVWEWMESPQSDTNYGTSSTRGLRGGSYSSDDRTPSSSSRNYHYPYNEGYAGGYDTGFRVASEVPEPATLSLLALGGLAVIRRRRK